MKHNDLNDFEFIKDKFEKTYPATPDSLSEDAINQLLLSKQGVNAQNGKRVKFTKALLIAAIIVVILSIAIPVSARYIYNDASDAIVQFFNDHFHIDLRAGNTNAINHSDGNDEIIKYLKEKGFDTVILPAELLNDEYEKTIVSFNENSDFLVVGINFQGKSNDITGDICLTKHKTKVTEFAIGQANVADNFDSMKQLLINGLDILVFSDGSTSVIEYVDVDTVYDIDLNNCDFETAIRIAETLDYSNDILRELNAKGFDSVILPAELLNDEYEKSISRYEENENFKQIEIDFKNKDNKIEGFFVIIKHISEDSAIAIGQGEIADEESVKQLFINGMDVLVFNQGDSSFIDYVDNYTEYEILINNCDFETAIRIAETLDYSNDILRELNAKGFDSVILPAKLLNDEYEKSIASFNEDKDNSIVEIDFENKMNGLTGYICIVKHITEESQIDIGQGHFSTEFDSVKQLTINGLDIIVLNQGNSSFIDYVDANTEYEIEINNCDFETAIRIAETLG